MFFEKNNRCLFNWFWNRNAYGLITSYYWLVIFDWCNCGYNRFGMACLLNMVYEKGRVYIMKIVVKKVPKFLRGFVKLIFGIKD